MTARSALRVVESHARVYRKTWRGSVISAFVNPVLFLLAMGISLGSLVDAGESDLGVPYLVFLAPALMAATAMQVGAGDASYPVMAGLKWRKTYHAALSTPLEVSDLIAGHLGWLAVRLTFVTVVYGGIVALFGASPVLGALLAVPPSVLTGVAVGSMATAYTANLKHEQGLAAMFRFAVLPMFLFSGTFFPIDQLPGWLEPVALVVPLYHGVSLARGVATDLPFEVQPVWSIAYLLLWIAVGAVLAHRAFAKKVRP